MSDAAVDLDYDAVLRDARERAGLGSFSNEFYLPVVRRLLEGFDREANLNATGRAIQRERIVGQLATNLRFESYWQQYPEIAQEKIEAPIVIVGFGRTGSTLLQRLLAADPRAHAPLWWEGRFPVPFAGESIENPEQRIKTALAEVEMMYATVPGLESIHPLDAMQADEEILLLEQSFFSDTPGYKSSNPVVSDDGKRIAFQLAVSQEAAGVGHGLFILDLEKAQAARR